MSDQNLVNEKKSLLDEVKVIQDNAKAQEELKPKGERLLEINNSLIAEIDKEAGITYE